jgi:hypothetical protein
VNGQACGADACAHSFENEQESAPAEPKQARKRERLRAPANGPEQGKAIEEEREQVSEAE